MQRKRHGHVVAVFCLACLFLLFSGSVQAKDDPSGRDAIRVAVLAEIKQMQEERAAMRKRMAHDPVACQALDTLDEISSGLEALIWDNRRLDAVIAIVLSNRPGITDKGAVAIAKEFLLTASE